MSIEVLVFCLVATFVTFTAVCFFAAANPKMPRRSYNRNNWGSYSESDLTEQLLVKK